MTSRLRCSGCLFAALGISAALHLALAGTLLWSALEQAPSDSGELALGVSLAMFVDLGDPGGAEVGPAAQEPTEPERPPEPVESETEPLPEPPPEPIQEPVPEPIPEAVPAPAPKVEAVTPVPEAKPASKPVVKAKPKRKPKPKRNARPSKSERSARASTAKTEPTAAAASVGGTTKGGAASSGAAGSSVRAAVEEAYLRGLQQAIGRNRFYPPGARREDLKGVVTVAFTVQGDGRLSDIRVAKGSGHSALDEAAVETLRRLGRYKPIPSETGRSRWPVRVPIVFDLR